MGETFDQKTGSFVANREYNAPSLVFHLFRSNGECRAVANAPTNAFDLPSNGVRSEGGEVTAGRGRGDRGGSERARNQ